MSGYYYLLGKYDIIRTLLKTDKLICQSRQNMINTRNI